MPNIFAPFGFRQTQGTGALPTYEQVTNPGGIAYTLSTPIFFGDPVRRASTSDSSFIQAPGVAAVDPIAGVFAGCKYMSTVNKRTVWSNYWPGGSDVAAANQPLTEAYYINDPLAQFIVQAGPSGTGTVTPAMVGLNTQFVLGTGNAANGLSGAYIDVVTTAPAATSTLAFRIAGLITFPPGQQGTAANGANNFAIVAFNNVETKSLTAY